MPVASLSWLDLDSSARLEAFLRTPVATVLALAEQRNKHDQQIFSAETEASGYGQYVGFHRGADQQVCSFQKKYF